MMISTHTITSIALAGAVVSIAYNFGYTIDKELLQFIIPSILLGTAFPDIDEPESWIGRRTRGISDLIKIIFGHRGITHTLIFILVFTLILIAINIFYGEKHFFLSIFGFAFGMLGHIIGDAHTKSGIMLFYPFSKKRYYVLPKFLRFKTGGIKEQIFALFYSAIIMVEITYIFQKGTI